jgi:ABC-type Zn uptake system ZnuABC Zn-binding protein ZnuA
MTMPFLTGRTGRAAALALLLQASCGRGPVREPGSVTVVTTFHALSTVIAPVVGPAGSVHVLLPGGASPHAYEPRPSDLRELSRASLLFYAGPNVDGWASRLASTPAVALAGLVPDSLLAGSEARSDPHLWLDPALVAAALPGLAESLCSVDAGNCDGYRERARAFAASIPDLVRRIRDTLGTASGSSAVVSGPFLAWWSLRFGPRIAGVIEESEGVEPSAARIRAMIDTARSADLVIGQATLPDEAARAVAESASIPYVTVDAVGTPGTAPDYERLLLAIAAAIAQPRNP